VIEEDDRVKITKTKQVPWRWVCSLRITAKDGSIWRGTGWLAGSRIIITAGHVVYMHKHGGFAKTIEVTLGRNGEKRPYGSCTSTNFRTVTDWMKKKKVSADYGAIILPAEFSYGKKLGYFGYADFASDLEGSKANIGGYPVDKPTGTLWFHARRIDSITRTNLIYNIDTAGGQSGSPVWGIKDGERYVVGIHTNGGFSGNSGVRITKSVIKKIRQWRAE
jgi:glutamyl endopeptidase